MTLTKLRLKYNINGQPTQFDFSDVKWHPLQPVKLKVLAMSFTFLLSSKENMSMLCHMLSRLHSELILD